MKKLAVSMALVLTASILMSSSAFAATLKPKNAPKTSSKASSSTSEKADSKKAETGKDAKTNVLLASNDSKTMKITAPKVAAVKTEKIKVLGAAGTSAATVDATIYEIESDGTIVTTSKGKRSTCVVGIYLYNEKSKTYELYPEPASEKIGSISLVDFGVPVLFQFAVIDPDAPSEFCMTLGSTTYVRVLPAK